MSRYLMLVLLFCMGCITQPAAYPLPQAIPVEELARQTLRSTLEIRVGKLEGEAKGSAWVLYPGVAVTAKHVTDGAFTYALKARDGELCHVKRVLEHPTKDIALVAYKGCEDVPALPVRTEPVTEGTAAFVAGHPLALSWSFTRGIVSDAADGEYIYLDAVAERGNSGGPAVDKEGRVIGMAVMIVGDPLGATWGGITMCVKIDDIIMFLLETNLRIPRPLT